MGLRLTRVTSVCDNNILNNWVKGTLFISCLHRTAWHWLCHQGSPTLCDIWNFCLVSLFDFKISKSSIWILQVQFTNHSTSPVFQFSSICARAYGACSVEGALLWSPEFLAAVSNHSLTYPALNMTGFGPVAYSSLIGGSSCTLLFNKTYLACEKAWKGMLSRKRGKTKAMG